MLLSRDDILLAIWYVKSAEKENKEKIMITKRCVSRETICNVVTKIQSSKSLKDFKERLLLDFIGGFQLFCNVSRETVKK